MDVFDTFSIVIGYDESEEAFQTKIKTIHDCLLEYHRLFDIYNEYGDLANLKVVNDNAGEEPIKTDPKIIELLKFGQEAYYATGGRVNIASGALLEIWHDARTKALELDNSVLPDDVLLKEASEHIDIEDLVIDEESSTVYFKDPYLKLDVGSIAKGYSVEMAGRLAESIGAESMLLNIGGNIKAIGIKGDGKAWVCPVENPFYKDREDSINIGDIEDPYAATERLEDCSLVTSGDYERFFIVDGVRYHHIIDTATLYPSDFGHRSVSILSRDAAWADVWSTALFLCDIDTGRELVEEWSAEGAAGDSDSGDGNVADIGAGIVADTDNGIIKENAVSRGEGQKSISIMWIEANGEKILTEGFEDDG